MKLVTNVSGFKFELFWQHERQPIFDLRRPNSYHLRIKENLMVIFSALGNRAIDYATLSKLMRHRKKEFLKVFRKLVEDGIIEKYGAGKKGAPFVYKLAYELRGKYQESDSVNV